jgi:hypothetical protein
VSEPPLQLGHHATLTGGIPYGRLFAALAVAVLVLQIVALGLAAIGWRRTRRQPAGAAPPLRLPMAAGAAILGLGAVAVGSVRAARSIATDAFDVRRAPWDAAHAIGVQIAAFAPMTALLLVVTLIWIGGLWLTVDARRRVLGGPFPPVAAVASTVALGLVPTIVGIWRWRESLLDAFDAIAGPPAVAYDPTLLRATDAAGARLETFAGISSWVIVALAVVALGLIVRADRRSQAPADRAETTRSSRGSRAISALALAAAALLLLAARPMRAENRLPWPPNHDDDRAWMERTAPDLAGPDEIDRAPVVHVWPPASHRPPMSEIWLDDHAVAPASLVDKLWVLRDEITRRHPDSKFNGAVVAVISRDAPYGEIVSALRAMHDAGFPHPQFAFTQWEIINRPTLGTLKRLRATGVRVTLVDDMDKEYAEDVQAGVRGALVRLSEFDSYEALARKLVDVRRAGQAVVLDLEALK